METLSYTNLTDAAEITEWLDDNTAIGRFEGRKARLERIGG